MELGQDRDVVLHEGGYWGVDLCTGVSGSGGVASTVGLDGTGSAGSGGGVAD